MAIEIEMRLNAIETPLKHKYMMTAYNDDFELARLTFVRQQFFFTFSTSLGFNKGTTVSHEWNISNRKLYYHIICCKHGDKIVSEADREFSITASNIMDTLMLSKTDESDLVKRGVGSFRFEIFKNTYREIDRSGKQKNKELCVGLCICLDPIIEALELNKRTIHRRLNMLNMKQKDIYDMHLENQYCVRKIAEIEKQLHDQQTQIDNLQSQVTQCEEYKSLIPHIPMLQQPNIGTQQ